jgi:hypothetical protein
MRDWNRNAGLMLRTLIGTVLLAYAAVAGAERLSLEALQAQITNLQAENAAQATLLQSQAAATSALNVALAKEVTDRKAYADSVGASTLASAKAYSDGQLVTAKSYADDKVAPVADKLIHFSRNGNEVYITGANLNIRNGAGGTYAYGVNGLGNLIVGYNELRTGAGAVNDRTGSHNVILGFNQNYSKTGAFMSGAVNNSTNHFASVLGGTGNTSGGYYSVVVGGYNNSATGNWSTILGGSGVTAPNQLDHKP